MRVYAVTSLEVVAPPLLLLEHLAKDALFVGHEGLRRIKLNGLTLVHDEDFVAPDYSVESVGYAQDSRAVEFFIYELLDCLLGHHVDVGSGFIEDDNLVAAKDCSDDTDELALTDTKVLAFFLDFEFEALAFLFVIIFFAVLFFIFFLFLLLLFFGGLG